MEISNDVVQATVPFFDGKDYKKWEIKMKVFLEYQDLLDVVERGVRVLLEEELSKSKSEAPLNAVERGTPGRLGDSENESELEALIDVMERGTPPLLEGIENEGELAAFLWKKDRKALYFIQQGVNNSIFEKIAHAQTATEAWYALMGTYEPPGVRPPPELTLARKEEAVPHSISNDREKRDEYLNGCVTMYHAAMNGDWKAADAVISKFPGILHTAVTDDEETALHIAAAAKQRRFVKKLIGKMTEDDLLLQNKDKRTALSFAAASGVQEIAEAMVNKNPKLLLIREERYMTPGFVTPLHVAALYGHRKMVLYLYGETQLNSLQHHELVDLFHVTIASGIYDVALMMLQGDKSLAVSRDQSGQTALHLLARKPSAISSESHLGFFKRLIISCCKSIFHKAWMQTMAHQLVEEMWKQIIQLPHDEISALISEPSRLLFDAAESGNVEFLVVLLSSYPELTSQLDGIHRTLFHVAAINRQENVFNLLYELGAFKDWIAARTEHSTGNTMLHLVASFPPADHLQIVSGAAIQMHRELLWFEAVKNIVPVPYIKMKNDEGELPQELFTKHHKELQAAGEKWMKDTATSCMIVATLVATVVFAAAFTVPGGNNQDTGIPILKRDKWFNIFTVSDSVALCTSASSVVLFLSILTSRYAESDFRSSLPLKLTFGLLALAISISSMLLAFSASFFLVYNEKGSWIPIFNISLASVVALLYGVLHGGLLLDTIRSTIWSSILFRPFRRRLFRRRLPFHLSRVLESRFCSSLPGF